MVGTAIRAKKLLHAAAAARDARTKSINKKEIKTKIGEIKYLSTQKNVPRLSLRKEIVHLEQKLQHVFDLEERLLKNEKNESQKVVSLKKQIDSLKNRLNSSEDKELQKKVSKLYHILTELLAKSELKRDVALSQTLLKELQTVDPQQASTEIAGIQSEESLKVRRVAMLLHRIKSVKHELELKAELMSSDPVTLAKIKEEIATLEVKIADLSAKYPEVVEELAVPREQGQLGAAQDLNPEASEDIKHTMMMGPGAEPQVAVDPSSPMAQLQQQVVLGVSSAEETQIEDEVISELPLPPPPRIRKK